MKTLKKSLFVFASVLLVMIAVCSVAACKRNKDDNGDESAELVALDSVAVSEITYDGKTISWGAVANAASYRVFIGNTEIYNGLATSCSYDDPGSDFAIKIQPVAGAETQYTNGSGTTKDVKHLGQVTGFRVEAGILYWNAVVNADAYVVKVNGVEQEVSSTQFDGLPVGIGASTFVKAISKKQDVIFFSDYSNETATCLLPAPILSFTNSSRTVTWDSVQNAEGYSLILEKDGSIIQSANIGNLLTFAYAYTDVGTYTVRVLANPKADSGLTGSKYSAPITITRLGNPTGINVQQALNDNTNVTFNDIAQASSFDVFVNGVEVGTTTRNSFEYHFNASASEQIHIVKIVAKGNGHTVLDADGNGSTFEITKLGTPQNLQLTSGGQQVRWNSVNKATGYIVYINGNSFVTAGTEYELPALSAGTHNIRVVARGNGTNIADSDLSVYLEVYKLIAPANLHISSSVLEWSPVQSVENYVVYIDSYKYNVGTNSFTVDPNYISATSRITVVAKGNGNNTLDSEPSAGMLVHRLAAPTNVSVTNDNILWNSVPGATKYALNVNDQVPKQIYGTSYPWAEFSAGEKRITVQAIGDGQTYFDSPVSVEVIVTKLAAPVISLGTVAYEWVGITGAANYQILCNGYNQVLASTDRSYAPQYTEAGEKSFKIRAIGNAGTNTGSGGMITVSSDYAEITHNVEARTAPSGNNPFTVTKNGDTFTVTLNNYVDGLTYYFNVSGENHEIASNSFSFNKTDAGGFTVRIGVKGDGLRYVDSIYTPSKTYVCLNAVTNITCVVGNGSTYQISWTGSQGASMYRVEFDLYNGSSLVRSNSFDQLTSSFSVDMTGCNKIVVRVTALGDGVDSFDSATCEKILIPRGE